MKRLGLAVCMATASVCATAGGLPFYVGGDIGFAKTTLSCTAVGLNEPCSADKDSTAWNLYGGYRFTPVIGLEVNYWDFGSLNYSGQVGWNNQAVNVNDSLKSTGMGVGGNFHFDLSPKWSTEMRVGYMHIKTKTNTGDLHKNPGYFGLDVGYLISPGLSVRGGFNFTTLVSPVTDYNYTASILSAGLAYQF